MWKRIYTDGQDEQDADRAGITLYILFILVNSEFTPLRVKQKPRV